MVYIPKGFAHGFYALEDDSTMVYKTSAVYSPAHDSGILWNSIAFKRPHHFWPTSQRPTLEVVGWPCDNPLISERDWGFPSLEEFLKRKIF